MSRSVRALVVDLSTRFGGTSARVLGLMAGMPAGSITLASLAGSPVTDQAHAARLAVHVVGRSKWDPRIPGRIATLARAVRADLIDAQNPQSKLWASRAAAALPIAFVSTLNSWYLSEHGGNWKGRLYHRLEQRTSRRLDLYIAVSREIEQQLLDSGVPSDQIALVENAIRADLTGPLPDKGPLRQQLNIPHDAQVLCVVGRLVKVKGMTYLLQSMRHLAASFPKLQCLIIGDGELRQQLEREITQYGLRDRVTLMGFQQREQVLQLVGAADLFVMPSLSEGTPVALLEAAALAKPIVASRVGGIPTMVTDQDEARLVPPADVNALTEALASLLTRTDLAAQLGARARARALRDFGPASQVTATHVAYERALKRAATRLGQTVCTPACPVPSHSTVDAATGHPLR
jgi:glycosyltransferase involved in cell wall biosynthesis